MKFPPQQIGGHCGQRNQADFEFVVGGQGERCNHANQQRAQRTTDGDHQVKSREITRMRLCGNQLAVTKHARHEQSRREQADLPIEHEMQIFIGERPGHRDQHHRQ